MRLVLAFVMTTLVACVPAGEPARRHRWPGHREEKDQQIADLLKRVENLEHELAQTNAAIAKLHVEAPVPPPPAPAAPPPATP